MNLLSLAADTSRLTNEVITHTHHHPGPGCNAHTEAECRAAVSNRFGFKWRCLTAGGVHVVLLITSTLAPFTPTHAQQNDWVVDDGFWFTNQNWSLGSVPQGLMFERVSLDGTARIETLEFARWRDLYIGLEPGSNGELVVDGGPITVFADGASTIVGSSGNGSVTLGNASLRTTDLVLGEFESGRGVVNIKGGTSPGRLSVRSGSITSGAGSGVINFDHSGEFEFVSALNLNPYIFEGNIAINHLDIGLTRLQLLQSNFSGGINVRAGTLILSGDLNASAGDLAISSSGSNREGYLRIIDGARIDTPGVLAVGNSTFGELSVTDGSQVSVSSAQFALGIPGMARVDLSGVGTELRLTGADLAVGGNLDFGARGNAQMTIRDGASLILLREGATALFSQFPGSSSDVVIRGNGSRFSSGGTIVSGVNGDVSITVEQGGMLEADDGAGVIVLGDIGGSSVLQVGNNSAAGKLNVGTIASFQVEGESTLRFNHTDENFTLTNSLGESIDLQGPVDLHHTGSGQTVLSQGLSHTGDTRITNGKLTIDGELENSRVEVDGAGVLGGAGDINHGVTIQNGGGLSPGNSSTRLMRLGELILDDTSVLSFELGSPVSGSGMGYDRVDIVSDLNGSGSSGELVLDGILNISDLGGFGDPANFPDQRNYLLIAGSESITDNGLVFGSGVLAGFNYDVVVNDNVFLTVDYDGLQFWDGDSTLPDNAQNGGDGIWGDETNWTGRDGNTNTAWSDLTAVFGGDAGNVEVDGDRFVSGVQFQTDGYRLLDQNGDGQLVLADGADTEFRVNSDALAHIDVPVVGGGRLIKSGDGDLRLLANNGYKGGTLISGGSLIGSAVSLGGNILNNANLVLDENQLANFAGSIGGNGSLTKTGSGRLVFDTPQTYLGGTLVSEGELAVNTETFLSSRLAIAGGATLSGNGSLRAVELAGGTLAPGNSIGTLSLENLSGPGRYEVELNAAGESDLVRIADVANLDAIELALLPQSGQYAFETRYIIVEAGQVEGEFSNVDIATPDFAFLLAELDYLSDRVELTLTRDDLSLAPFATNPNEDAVAEALTSAYQGRLAADIQSQLFSLETSQVGPALASLSGNQLSLASSLSMGAAHRFAGVVNDRLSKMAANPGSSGQFDVTSAWQVANALQAANLTSLSGLTSSEADPLVEQGSGLWLTPWAGKGEIDGSEGAAGTDYHYGGIAGGFDHWISDSTLLGAGVTYQNLDADEISVESLALSLYGQQMLAPSLYLSGQIGWGRHSSDSERVVRVGSVTSVAVADFGADTRNAGLELGYRWAGLESTTVTPFVGAQYLHLDRESFRERGSGDANLRLDSEREESMLSRVGLDTSTEWESDSDRVWRLNTELAWAHEFGDNVSNVNAAFSSAPEYPFRVRGPELDQDRLQAGLGVAMWLFDGSTLQLRYRGEIASTNQDHGAYATVRFEW
ncbi:MAG TPA: autotransporter domain-containing protein [Marinobacter sp.]|nr:autotransporter domain-containing protein [Marinobacter sp.]